MTPITMVEGAQKLDPVSERNLAERRFSALASAVREHEALVRRREYANAGSGPGALPAPAADLRRALSSNDSRAPAAP